MLGYQRTLLQLLSKALFDNDESVSDTDWIEVLKEAKNQAVIQLAYSALDKTKLSSEEATRWKQAASVNIANNIRVGYNHSCLHEWMSRANIPYVILKGSASAAYYPKPVYRSMGDVDFLVKDEDLDRAGKVLEAQGLKPWDQYHISHIVYRGPQMHYEMHFNLAGTPNGAAGDLVREYIKDIFQKAQVQAFDVGNARLPSPFHHGIVLLLHTCHHLTGEGVGLRHLCDWAVFENSFSEEEFQGMFEEKMKRLGLWYFVRILTRVSIKYLGADERTWAVADDELVDALMEDILSGGNFGSKDSNRSIQTMLISNRGKDGVGMNSMLDQLFKSANQIVYEKWPASRKYKLLLPLGWLFFGVRRLIRELTGKRKKTNMRYLVNGAEERRTLYTKFHLYETER